MTGNLVKANQIIMHPGSLNQYSIRRWVAPSDMAISLNAVYERVDFQFPTTTDFHVCLNGINVFTRGLDSASAVASYDSVFSGAANTIVDFAVGYATNRNYFGDATGISAIISTVSAVTGTPTFGLVLGRHSTVPWKKCYQEASAEVIAGSLVWVGSAAILEGPEFIRTLSGEYAPGLVKIMEGL